MKRSGKGWYGTYYQLSSVRGLKVLNGNECEYNESPRLLMGSDDWSMAKEEYKLLRRAHKSNHSPRPHGIAIVKKGKYYYAGIVMQHISGPLFGKMKKKDKRDLHIKYCGVHEFLIDKLEDAGIQHEDMNSYNIIIKTVGKSIRPYAIDFSPQQSYNTRRSR